jgi:hypothetical protein
MKSVPLYTVTGHVLMPLWDWSFMAGPRRIGLSDQQGGPHMPIISQIICDGCQAVKKQTNHWYTLVFTEEHQACLRPMAMTPTKPLEHWMDSLTALPLHSFQSKAHGLASRLPSEPAAWRLRLKQRPVLRKRFFPERQPALEWMALSLAWHPRSTSFV